MPPKHRLRCDNWVFVGGQVSMDPAANIIASGEVEIPTRTSMDNIGKLLDGFGLDHSDFVKLNTYCQGPSGDEGALDADALHCNVTFRSCYFEKPGPASTDIPFRCVAYEGMMIEIEAIDNLFASYSVGDQADDLEHHRCGKM